MGGMFTVLKVREGLASYDEDPGWYQHPPGTVAEAVGPRQAVAPTTTMPRRRVPLPEEPHAGHDEAGRGATAHGEMRGGIGALPHGTELFAVKAGSCAAPASRR
jgi:hypothetical protein